MEELAFAARLVLAAVFAVAALAKLADRQGTRQAVADFGIPAALAGPVAFALPIAELAAAVMLIPTATATAGGVAALALLVPFTLGIGANLARGRKPECHCFGQIGSSPIGWPTLARNAVLASLAAVVAWGGPGSAHGAVGWVGDLRTGEAVALVLVLALLVAVAAAGWVLLSLLQQNGRMLLRLEALEGRLGQAAPPATSGTGLPVGTPAPDFRLKDLQGDDVRLASLLNAGRPLLIVFTDPKCGPCTALLPEVGRWQREHERALTIAVVSKGGVDEPGVAEHELRRVLLDDDGGASAAYQAWGTPSAVVVSADGTLASRVMSGADAIGQLVQTWSRGLPLTQVSGNGGGAASARRGLPRGERLPALSLPDLQGRAVDIAEPPGKPTVLILWSPTCGFCQRMLPDLKAWEAAKPATAPGLLVISRGTAAANETMGLRSPILLDEDFRAGRSLGANGTPNAVLIDGEGRVASDVAVGADAVLALCRGEVAVAAN